MTPAPADQAVRDRVVRDFDTTFLLEAGAGTGKTTSACARASKTPWSAHTRRRVCAQWISTSGNAPRLAALRRLWEVP